MERVRLHCLLILTVLVSGNRAQATTPQSATRNRDECAVVDGLVVDGRIVLDSAALNPAEGRNVQQVLDCLPAHATVVIRMSDLRWESVLEIKKPVTLLGEGTSIQCRSEKNLNAIQIRSDNVTLSELRFVGCKLENEMALIDVKNSDDVTLRGLYFESNTNRNGSACISVGNSTLHLSNITARSNVGTHGGVVSVINGSAVVLDKSEMHSNRGLDDGGAVGIYNAKMSISECRFKGNQARDGGAISVEGDVGAEIIIRDSEFIGGPVPGGSPTNFTVNARLGGAIELIGPEVNATIYNNTFHRNSALIQGGSIFSQNSRFVTITETTFLHSSAGQGGSIFLSQNEQNGTAAVKIRNSVFRDNFAISGVIVEEEEVIPVGGAARFVNLTDVSIVNSSFTGNNGTYGGGLAAEGCAVLAVDNSVFSENKAVREWEDGVTVPAGGAMLLVNVGILSIQNSTLFRNEAFLEGGTALSTSLFSDGFYYDTTSFSGFASGGAIYLSGSVKNCSITASNFVENRAELGGAVDLFEVNGGGVEISGSEFFNNHAVEGGGALIFQHVPLSVEILSSNFTNNTVAFRAGGGIVAYDAGMSVKSSTFTRNAVENGSGGAMYVTGSMNATVEATTLISNSAAMGGAIFVDQKANFLLRNSTCELNTAKYGGGALYAQNWGVRNRFAHEEDSNFHVVGSNFVGNEASWNFEGSDDLGIPGRGGALMIEGRGVQVYLGGCSFSSNAAGIGGAAYLEQVKNTNVEACEFTSNAALTGGAVSFRTSTWLRSFSFNCTTSTFANNIAREGGAFSFSGLNIDSVMDRTPAPFITSYAYFINDTFVNNTASEGGGAFDVSERDVFFGLCFFASNHAGSLHGPGEGGGVRVRSGAFADFHSTSVVNCTGRLGGGVFVRSGVARLRRSELSGNDAEEKGGAIATVFDQPMFGTVTLDDCVVQNNRARKGGGFHLITESSFATLCGGAPSRTTTPQSPRDHLKSLHKHFREFVALLEKCEAHFSPTDAVERDEHAYVLNNTKLAGNGATEAASEIFVSEPSTLKICCGEDCFTGSSLRRAPSCSSQYQKRGPSEAMAVGGGMDRVVSHPSTIEGYSSGEVLEPIEVVLLDSFGQPAFENVTLRMELATSEGDLSGNPVTENGVLMSSQFVVEGVVLRAMPGTYNVSFSFTPNEEGGKFLSTFITIVVRECVVGEVSKDDGRRCEKCKPGFFSFDTADKNCELCPGKKATCYGSTLSPADGFWHSEPHSTDVHSCLLEEACMYDNRTEILQESSLRNGAIIDSGEGYPQCAQGYEGVLCGSCTPTHGKERSLRCVECGAKSSSGLMYGAVMLALLIISMVYVRSVRVHSKKVIAQANAALPTRGGSEHVLEVEGDNLPCIDNKGGEQKKKAEFSDVIKILVNFAQVTGAAASIHADWTDSMLTVLSALDVTSGVGGSSFLAFDCAFPSTGIPRSIKTTILLAFIPFIVWFAFVLFYAWRRGVEKRGLHSFTLRCFVAFLAVLQASYLSLTRVLVRIFYCVSAKPLGSLFWVEDTNVVCYQGSHLLLLCLLGIPLLLTISVGFPVGLFVKLTRSTGDLDDPGFVRRYGPFYQAYNENAVAWDVLILARKALISVVVVFGRTLGEDVQGQMALFIIVVSVVLQMGFWPFKDPKLNVLELASLCVSALAFSVGNIVNGETVTTGARSFLSVLFIAVVLGYICYVAKQLHDVSLRSLRAWVENSVEGCDTASMKNWVVVKTAMNCGLKGLNASVESVKLTIRRGESEAQEWIARKLDRKSVK